MNPIRRAATRCLLLGWLPLVLASSGQAEASSIFDWHVNPDNGHEYRLTSIPESWTDAEAEAQSLGGYLVTLTSAAEENWFRSVFSVAPIVNETFDNTWMGLTDANSTPGNFQWVTGEALTFTDWRHGNPDNIGVEHYVMYFQGEGWDNRTNFDQQGPDPNGPHRLRYGVIERNATPEPASLTMAALGGLVALGAGVRGRRRRALA